MSGEWRVASGENERMVKSEEKGDVQGTVSWETVIPLIRGEFAEAARRDGAGVGAVLSPYLTCEEGYLAGEVHQGTVDRRRGSIWVGCPCRGRMTPIRRIARGGPVQPVKFTIHAEKCPNRRGIEEILKHFQGEVQYFRQGS